MVHLILGGFLLCAAPPDDWRPAREDTIRFNDAGDTLSRTSDPIGGYSRYKSDYRYSEGRLVENLTFAFLFQENRWDTLSARRFAYDTQGRMSRSSYWSHPDGGLLEVERTVLSYTGSRVDSAMLFGYGQSSLVFQGTVRYEYLPSGALRYQTYFPVGNSPAWRVEHTYDSHGRLFQRQQKNRSGGQWVLSWRETYAYDDQGRVSLVVKERDWGGGWMINSERWRHEYLAGTEVIHDDIFYYTDAVRPRLPRSRAATGIPLYRADGRLAPPGAAAFAKGFRP